MVLHHQCIIQVHVTTNKVVLQPVVDHISMLRGSAPALKAVLWQLLYHSSAKRAAPGHIRTLEPTSVQFAPLARTTVSKARHLRQHAWRALRMQSLLQRAPIPQTACACRALKATMGANVVSARWANSQRACRAKMKKIGVLLATHGIHTHPSLLVIRLRGKLMQAAHGCVIMTVTLR